MAAVLGALVSLVPGVASAATGDISKVAGCGAPSTTAPCSPLVTVTLGDGGAATDASLLGPAGVAVDGSGNLYVADTSNNRVRKISASSGVISTVAGLGRNVVGFGIPPLSAGDGGQATNAFLQYPSAVAVDGSGNLYIADTDGNRVRKVDSSGIITTVAGTGTAGFGGDTGAATGAKLDHPAALALDSSGNLYIADEGNDRIRKVSTSGVISTVVGGGTPATGNGDGGSPTSAKLVQPSGVAVDSSGNIFISDTGEGSVRKVASGTITSVATGLGYPMQLTVDSLGNIYVAEMGSSRIRKIPSSGSATTVAGTGTAGFDSTGPPVVDGDSVRSATAARLSYPRGVARDSSGNLYIADTGNNRVRKVAA